MYIVIWQYSVNPQHLQSFIDYYHAAGEWVKFFQPSPQYFGTEFYALAESDYTFITIDKWMTQASYEQFLAEHKEAYQQLDKQCEGFTVEETLIGKYLTIEI
jgi:hypothetical protein